MTLPTDNEHGEGSIIGGRTPLSGDKRPGHSRTSHEALRFGAGAMQLSQIIGRVPNFPGDAMGLFAATNVSGTIAAGGTTIAATESFS